MQLTIEDRSFRYTYLKRVRKKRIKFACNYLRSQTISVEEFMVLYNKKEENEKIIL